MKIKLPVSSSLGLTYRTFTAMLFTAALAGMTARAQLTWDPAQNGSGSGGAGTWDLSSTHDWYTGSADIIWGDNSASGTNTAIFGGTGGTVMLNTSLSASNLTFNATGYTISGSGTLTLGAGGINASSVGSGTITVGVGLSLPSVQEPWQVGSGGTLAINGAVTRATGASVDFSPNDVTPTGITTTSPNIVNDAGGIIDGWATEGNYVSSTTSGDFLSVSAGSIIQCNNYLPVSASASTTPNTNTIWMGNLVSGALNGANDITTVTNSTVINSLVQQGDFVVNDGATLTVNSGGIIQRGTARWLIDQAAGEFGTAVLVPGTSSGELFIHTPDAAQNNWVIWPRIQDNGATKTIVIKDGPGIVAFNNTNSYSGGTIINNGILAATHDEFTHPLNTGITNAQSAALGIGPVTVNPLGVLEVGFGTGNAGLNYPVTNSLIISGGKVLADDGHNYLNGPINVLAAGATFGSTYDGGASPTTGNKGLFLDGVISGSGPITLQQAVTAGDSDNYGNGNGNAFNSSFVAIENNNNTYSGTVTIIPFQTGNDAGSYLAVNGSTVLQFATLNLTNNTGVNHRFAAVGGITSAMIFNSGLGSSTLGAITGSGNIILQGYNEFTYTNTLDPIALSVGNNNSSTTYSGTIVGSGSLNKVGTGTLTISTTPTYTGNTTVSGGTLALTGGFVNSSNIIVAQGATLNVSALGTATLASAQNLYGSGIVNGSVSANSGSEIFGDSGSPYGTNTFNNNLTLNSGALAHLSVSTSATGPNDLINVVGTLTANGNVIHVSAPSTSVSLQTADYTLITAGSISGSFAPGVSWDVAPANAGNFSIVTSGTTVKLHYAAATSPTGAGTATPNPAVRNQNVLVTVTTTNGTGGTVNSVVVNAGSIGGSSSLALVNAGGNVWTNSVLVSSNTLAGSVPLVATITDTASLNGIANVPLNIIVTNRVWNGLGANANWGDGPNWTDLMAPGLVGDSIEFGASSDLSPNMDSSYTNSSLTFDVGAGAYNISSGNSSVLTLTGGITNNSANAQTINVVIGGTAGLTKSGNGTINLTGNEIFTGNIALNAGTLNVSGNLSGNNSDTGNLSVGGTAGNAVLNLSSSANNVSPFYLLIGNVANSVGAVYENGGNVTPAANSGFDNVAIGNVGGSYGYYDVAGGTLAANGVALAGEDNTGGGANFGGAGGSGIMDIQSGAIVNDEGWFVISRNTSGTQTGILNVYSGGTMNYNGGGLVCNWGGGGTTIINVWGTIAPPLLTAVGVGLGGGTAGVLNLETGGVIQGSVFGGNFGGTGGVINFNGGTLQALPSLATPVAGLIAATAMYSYSGGAILDYNGSAVTNAQPLLAPAGKGIYSASVTSGGTGYVAPPIVTVVPGVGDTTGSGATAIAQINPASGQVTTVIITSPGQNYTATPTFTLAGGGGSGAVLTAGAPQANTSGGLTVVNFAGGGFGLVLSGVSTYTGSTTISNDGVAATLALAGNGSIATSTNITTQAGCVFDVTALSSYTLASGQYLSGLGNVNGSVTAGAGSYVSAGQAGTLGVNTFNNALTLASGAAGSLALTTTYNGQNDQIVVSGALTANNNVIHLQAPSTSSSLDTTADYVLIQAGSISGTFSSAPVWDVAPVNAGHYTIVTSGTQVTLHYNAAVSSPTVTGTITPSPALRNQPVLVTANVTPGSASISTVKADFTSIGGSVVSLVESNSSTLWTNTVAVPPAAAAGSANVTVTATDSASNSGSVSVPLTIIIGNDVWNGVGANANFSTALNWTNKLAPGFIGDSLEFGTSLADLSPNVDNNYTVTSLTFDAGAGAFNISSANSSVLTMNGSGAIVNNSANTQTLNLVVADSGGGITKSGTGAVTLAGNNTYTGPTIVNAGTLNISGQAVAGSNNVTQVGDVAGNGILNVSGSGSLWAYSMQIGNASNAVGAVYQNGATVWANTNSGFDNLALGNVPGAYGYYDANGGTLTVSGIAIAGEGNSGRSATFNLAGNGLMDINGAAVTDSGWLVIARNNNNTNGNEIGVLNMFSGSLSYAGGGIVGAWDTGESAIINVMGGAVSNTAAVGVYLGFTNYEGILNLNGGVLQASVIQGYNGPTFTPVTYGQLNFNGGTLKASAGNAAFISTLAADIYGNGAVIDNNASSIASGTPLVAPAGNGVNGIASFTGGSGYIAPPIITVTNGAGDTTGFGATAIAQINPASGTVTNIIITCPGVNYTVTPVFIVRGGGATVAATITGIAPTANTSGGLTSIGSGTLTLSGANTYTGSTVISNGTLSLASGASIAVSPIINVGSGATFNVSAVTGFTLGAAQSITGNGTVNGSVTSSGTVAPGSAGAIGTLTFNNNLTLNAGSTVSVKLNETLSPAATNDQVVCLGTMTYGGTLAVSNPGGVLHVGDTFQLFLTGTASGNFTTITGSPGAGMAYSFNPSTGILSVISSGGGGITKVKFTGSPVLSGTTLSISATNTGAGTIYLLTSTNLQTPLISWTPVWTNVLSGNSAFSTNIQNAVKSGAKQQFYILSTTNQ